MKRQKMTRAAGRVLLALVASFALVMAGCSQPGDEYEGDDKNKTEQPGDGNGDTSGGGQQNGDGNGDTNGGGNGQQTGGDNGNGGGNDNDNGNTGGSGSTDSEFGIDWNSESWLPNGIAGEELGQKYKIYIETDSQSPRANELQKSAASNDNASIHVICGSSNIITSLGKGNFLTSSANLYLYLTNFTAKETKFTITDDGTEYTCYVYYADGTGTKVIDIEYSNDPAVGDDGKINWSDERWIPSANVDGVIYGSQYKIIAPIGNVVEIQKSGNAVKAAIYINSLPSTFSSCSLAEDEYIGQGDFVYLYIDAFTYKETKFTITLQDGSENEFWVYNDKGTDGIDDRTSSAGEDTTED